MRVRVVSVHFVCPAQLHSSRARVVQTESEMRILLRDMEKKKQMAIQLVQSLSAT